MVMLPVPVSSILVAYGSLRDLSVSRDTREMQAMCSTGLEKEISHRELIMTRTTSRVTCCKYLLFALLIVQTDATFAEEWVTLKGRVVFDGEVSAPAKLDITRDEEVCGEFGLTDESLLVNQQNQGLRNVVIWLSSKQDVPVHPEYSENFEKPVVLDNADCRFQPRIVPVRTNQILRVKNSDPVAHNVAVYARRNNPFSIVIPQDMPLDKTFEREELEPLRIDCSIHSWMRSYVVVTEHPYVAVTDKNGQFVIKNIPAGEWEFRFWHERTRFLQTIQVADQNHTLKRGTMALNLTKSEMDLGEIHIPADTEF